LPHHDCGGCGYAEEAVSNILIIDDDHLAQSYFEKVINKVDRRIEVVKCYSKAHAVSMLANRAFKLIMCDVLLNDGIGTDALIQFKDSLAMTPIMLCTNIDNSKEVYEELKEKGFKMVTLVPKPIYPDTIKDFIHDYH
jgi:DNA-binding NtrC family response regulator